MKQGNVYLKNGLYITLLMVVFLLVGCFEDLDGITCEVDDDCASGTCNSYGVCVGTAQSTDDDTNGTGVNNHGTDPVVSPIPLTGVDLLFVIDNSGSMSQEQAILADSMGTLTEMLSQGVDGVQLDVRMAVTTTDMGVSYLGNVYNDNDDIFDNPQVKCSGNGDNGEFISDSYACPDLDQYMTESGYLTPVNRLTNEVDWNGFVVSSACLFANVGADGCNYEQQLAAIPAAMTNHGQSKYLRPDAMTAIVVITDESDCSIGSSDWFELKELSSPYANLACGRNPEFLRDVTNLRDEIIAAKTAATGVDATPSVLFTAIAGVPIGSVCEGRGDELAGCMNVKPGVNGTGTMGNPDEIGRMTSSGVEQFYFEYACKRYAADANPETDFPVTAAYPASRIVEMAQQFGEMGFVYSICNDNWKPAMSQLGSTILQKANPANN